MADGRRPAQSPTEALFARTDVAVDAEFGAVFGSGGLQARAALERAAAAEGPAAYTRLGADPDAFGTVVGDRARAATLGQTLEALNYSKAVHAAEQGRPTPSASGNGPGRAPEPEQTGPDRDPRTAARAAATIRESLGGAVSHDDLLRAERAFYNLTPEEANAAFDQLMDPPVMGHWLSELDDFGVLGGYNADERARQLGSFAAHLDGARLSTLAGALSPDEMMSPGQGGLLGELGNAIGEYASPEVRAAFVAASRTAISTEEIAGMSVGNGWAEVSAAALYGTGPDDYLRGETLTTALEDFKPDQMAALFRNGVRDFPAAEQRALPLGVETERSARSLAGVIEEVSRTDDPALKAKAFVAASQVLGALESPLDRVEDVLGLDGNGPLVEQVSAAMTALANGRSNEFVSTLMSQEHDEDGHALTQYVEGLVESGQTETVAWHIGQLGRGNGQDEDALARFTADVEVPGEGTARVNAERLGHLMGAVNAAFLNLADRRKGVDGALADLAKEIIPAGQDQLEDVIDGIGEGDLSGDRERLAGVLASLEAGARPDATVGRSEFVTARDAVVNNREQ